MENKWNRSLVRSTTISVKEITSLHKKKKGHPMSGPQEIAIVLLSLSLYYFHCLYILSLYYLYNVCSRCESRTEPVSLIGCAFSTKYFRTIHIGCNDVYIFIGATFNCKRIFAAAKTWVVADLALNGFVFLYCVQQQQKYDELLFTRDAERGKYRLWDKCHKHLHVPGVLQPHLGQHISIRKDFLHCQSYGKV